MSSTKNSELLLSLVRLVWLLLLLLLLLLGVVVGVGAGLLTFAITKSISSSIAVGIGFTAFVPPAVRSITIRPWDR
ncbi:hypothetical protein [Streptomyces erythrochromogenes]|uniref:hypothetical protein n=1 Tax=Streptomyces erythrochromogenes TaxID=285574 RepID=UPI003702404F